MLPDHLSFCLSIMFPVNQNNHAH
uniref:Uncharacterized protein n=1 Tax=Anguilla anguilla TaxID=7936 RepID=A0A0E9VYQ6_ANGAN